MYTKRSAPATRVTRGSILSRGTGRLGVEAARLGADAATVERFRAQLDAGDFEGESVCIENLENVPASVWGAFFGALLGTDVVHLTLRNDHVTPQVAKELGEILADVPLESLDLGMNYLNAEGAVKIATALEQNTTLSSLLMPVNYIGRGARHQRPDGAAAIAGLVETNDTLTHLDISYNLLAGGDAGRIFESLGANEMLRVLEVGGNVISPDEFAVLAKALRTNTTLEQLDLRNTAMSPPSVRELCHALSPDDSVSPHRKPVGLVMNAVLAGVKAEAVDTSNTTLLHLNLSDNHVGCAGAEALAHMLRVNRTLTSLDLAMNCIGRRGGMAIAAALPTTALRELDLSETNVDEEVVEAVLAARPGRLRALEVDIGRSGKR